MVLVADDNMVDQLDLQQLTGADEVARHLDVSFRRGAFTAGVIVDDHDLSRCGDNRTAEHLTRMHQNGVHRADGQQLMAFNPLARV